MDDGGYQNIYTYIDMKIAVISFNVPSIVNDVLPVVADVPHPSFTGVTIVA